MKEVENYQLLKEIGSGNFGVTYLAKDKKTGDTVAIKFIERGDKIDKNVEREILNHRQLTHRNIVGFRRVFLTDTDLCIVMEYAAGGELFDRIAAAGRFSEEEARYFFQQLIAGVSYCHQSGVCHRDLKLENTLLDGSPQPKVKICDFGYSKSALAHSAPKSTVGTPAYIAPEVLQRKEYKGETADVWSLGVTLYVMLAGAYPFEDPDDPRNFRKTIQRIMAVSYTIPSYVHISPECRQLLEAIFVADPTKRITIDEIKRHPWFLKNLPSDLKAEVEGKGDKTGFLSKLGIGKKDKDVSKRHMDMQSEEEIQAIIRDAMKAPAGKKKSTQEVDMMDADI